jgi:hypothetical protein
MKSSFRTTALQMCVVLGVLCIVLQDQDDPQREGDIKVEDADS